MSLCRTTRPLPPLPPAQEQPGESLGQVLENLIHDCRAHAKDIQSIKWRHDEDDGGTKLSAQQILEVCDAAETSAQAATTQLRAEREKLRESEEQARKDRSESERRETATANAFLDEQQKLRAKVAELERLHLEALDEQAVQANIMRELERQLTEVRAERDELEKDVNALCVELRAHDATEAVGMIRDILGAAKDANALAVGIWKAEFSKDAPHWQPLPDLRGLISQIDNMYAGIRGQRDEARWQLATLQHEYEQAIRSRDELLFGKAPTLRPISEVSTIADGFARVFAEMKNGEWIISDIYDPGATHFCDIRLPAQKDPHAYEWQGDAGDKLEALLEARNIKDDQDKPTFEAHGKTWNINTGEEPEKLPAPVEIIRNNGNTALIVSAIDWRLDNASPRAVWGWRVPDQDKPEAEVKPAPFNESKWIWKMEWCRKQGRDASNHAAWTEAEKQFNAKEESK